mmetsp:Transcript_21824/g.32671  ORF Transcript_21824/g.32671 Transcript_21824/m.32671 type:complete len:277 (-) Transcript_21824:108-938(-)
MENDQRADSDSTMKEKDYLRSWNCFVIDGNRVIHTHPPRKGLAAIRKRPPPSIINTAGRLSITANDKPKVKLEVTWKFCEAHDDGLGNKKEKSNKMKKRKRKRVERTVEEADRKRHLLNIRKYKMFVKTAEYRKVTINKYLARLSSSKIIPDIKNSDECKAREEKCSKQYEQESSSSSSQPASYVANENNAQSHLRKKMISNTHSAVQIPASSSTSKFGDMQIQLHGTDAKCTLLAGKTNITRNATFDGTSNATHQTLKPEIIDLIDDFDDDIDDT